MRNMVEPDNILVRVAMRQLQLRLPRGWTVGAPTFQSSEGADATVELTAPDRRACLLSIEAKARLEPKAVRTVLEQAAAARVQDAFVVVAPYLSAGTQERLRNGGVGYLDLTGNIRIALANPGLYIESQGATENPNREERPARSLRGAKAGRVVRALIDRKEPPGVRELAALTQIDAGYVSRVLAMLDSEALITRVGRGRLQSVDWPSLLRRWAQESPLESRGTVRTYLEPRGLSAFLARLKESEERYVVTGSLAASAFAPIAASRLAMVWMNNVTAAAERLRIRPTESGTNVLLIEPNDEAVFDGARQRDGGWYAAPSQIAADLLSSPGRGPAEGEELLQWMLANEDKWRQ
jgi:hypothetical protein